MAVGKMDGACMSLGNNVAPEKSALVTKPIKGKNLIASSRNSDVKSFKAICKVGDN